MIRFCLTIHVHQTNESLIKATGLPVASSIINERKDKYDIRLQNERIQYIMSNKFTLISELAYQTAKEISQNSKNWTSFLKTVARQYKYQFSNQLLIYAQKPETSACATMDVWNKKLGR